MLRHCRRRKTHSKPATQNTNSWLRVKSIWSTGEFWISLCGEIRFKIAEFHNMFQLHFDLNCPSFRSQIQIIHASLHIGSVAGGAAWRCAKHFQFGWFICGVEFQQSNGKHDRSSRWAYRWSTIVADGLLFVALWKHSISIKVLATSWVIYCFQSSIHSLLSIIYSMVLISFSVWVMMI